MSNVIKILSVRTGDKYGVEYVYNLKSMIERNVSCPVDFYCLTDEPLEGINCKSSTLTGWWAKVELFRHFSGPCFYLDLDSIVVSSVAGICSAIDNLDSNTFMMLRRFRKNMQRPMWYWISGLMGWNGDWGFITEEFKQNLMSKYVGDDEFIEHSLKKHGAKIVAIQDFGNVVSYRRNMLDQELDNPPKGTEIVVFHTSKRPHQLLDVSWVKENWR